MKISRPPHADPPGSPGKAEALGGTTGKGFAAKLDQAERAASVRGAERPAAPRKASAIADIGADLKAGKITAEAAIDKVVERVLDRQLGKTAGAALRGKIGAALRESLADDPLLAAKVRALSQE
jgi:hypothetical protein